MGVANYSFVHSINDETGFQTYEFPTTYGAFAHGLAFGAVGLVDLRADGVGPRPRAQWTTDSLFPMVTRSCCAISLHLHLKLRRGLRVSASILNLFDQEHHYLVYQSDATEMKKRKS